MFALLPPSDQFEQARLWTGKTVPFEVREKGRAILRAE